MSRSICIVLAVILYAQFFPFCAHAQESTIDPWSVSFHDQIKKANDVYIQINIDSHLEVLDKLNKDMRSAFGARITPRLDADDKKEKEIAEHIQQLIAFQKKHNGRMDAWSENNRAFGNFLDPLRMGAAQVKLRKEERFKSGWSYVAVHWYPDAINLGLQSHEIPNGALQLNPVSWQDAGNEDARKYAFFSFLRKASSSGFNEEFLDNQTGYKSFWNISGETVHLSRWIFEDYYAYNYISVEQLPKAEPATLKLFIIARCAWSSGGEELSMFYNKKLGIFTELVEEMLRDSSINLSARPYMGVYSFFCRSFPCISAFKVRLSADGYDFIDGYDGDGPAKKVFSENSPMGMAERLYQRLRKQNADTSSCKELTGKIFSPIFLLQLRLPADRAAHFRDFPYEDIKVGFEGYLDFYEEVSSGRQQKTEEAAKPVERIFFEPQVAQKIKPQHITEDKPAEAVSDKQNETETDKVEVANISVPLPPVAPSPSDEQLPEEVYSLQQASSDVGNQQNIGERPTETVRDSHDKIDKTEGTDVPVPSTPPATIPVEDHHPEPIKGRNVNLDADIMELIQQLKDEDWVIRERAAMELAKKKNAASVEPLIALLRDKYWRVQKAAAFALSEIKDTSAVEPLITMLKDNDEIARIAAVRALNEIGDTRALEALTVVTENDENEDVRSKAKEVISEMKEKMRKEQK